MFMNQYKKLIFIYGEEQNTDSFKKSIQYCVENNIKCYPLKRTKDISTTDIINTIKNS